MRDLQPKPAPETLDLGARLLPTPENDSRGAQLLAQRVDLIPPLLDAYLQHHLPEIIINASPVTVTGLGSSLGHARYLSYLLNTFTHHHASTSTPVDFIDYFGGTAAGRGAFSILFSQGLSENTHAVITDMIAAGKGAIFTAASTSDEAIGDKKRTLLLDAADSGISIIPFPLPSEYQILVRVIGPYFGYLAAHRTVSELKDSRLSPASIEEYRACCLVDPGIGRTLAEKFPAGTPEQMKIILCPPTHHFAHNLAEKVKEGMFLPRPELVDVLEFDHGAFQNACRWNSRLLILSHQNATPELRSSIDRIFSSAERARLPEPFVLEAPATVRPELRVLWYEMAFNHWISSAVANSQIDQINWPGKGLDPNYNFTGK